MPKDFDAERYELEKGWNIWQRDLLNEIEDWPSTYLGLYARRVFGLGESREMTEGENETNG